MNANHPESIAALSQLAKGFHADHHRFQTAYHPDESFDSAVMTVILDKIARFPSLDIANGFLSFDAGVTVRTVLACLKETPYCTFPFTQMDEKKSIGYYFTHTGLFSSDSLCSLTWVQPDGKIASVGRKAFASVAGYRAIDLFLGTRNILGIPVHFVYKLQPATLMEEMKNSLYGSMEPVTEAQGEDRRILVRLKTAYDPFHILNTFNL